MKLKRRLTVTEETTTTVVRITREHAGICPACGFEGDQGAAGEGETEATVFKTQRIDSDTHDGVPKATLLKELN